MSKMFGRGDTRGQPWGLNLALESGLVIAIDRERVEVEEPLKGGRAHTGDGR